MARPERFELPTPRFVGRVFGSVRRNFPLVSIWFLGTSSLLRCSAPITHWSSIG